MSKFETELHEFIKKTYDELKDNMDGKVADYIPQLSKMDPKSFGIAACLLDGNIIEVGDTNVEFCLQSCSKPLNYCIARERFGKEKVHNHVGFEPSGREFNAFILNDKGLPHNPMINAGAIMTCSLLNRMDEYDEPAKRYDMIMDYYKKMSGDVGKIGFDNNVYLSEKHHADRNISLAYYMRENNAFGSEGIDPSRIQDILEYYFQCCSINITCKIGSVLAGTLANGGICPVSGKRVFSTETVKDTLSLMYMCGMYDYSGQFAFEIGLPAKSGVSGCLLLVVPNKMGICIWSPPLDKVGNTVRGIEFCKKLIYKSPWNFHIFHNIFDKSKNDE